MRWEFLPYIRKVDFHEFLYVHLSWGVWGIIAAPTPE